ncbi:Rieske (2Fe-2S) protein [Neorhizobium sp. IRAMC:178]|uniref:Rieske (2Fe-2S) protein n=1 Tax=Neorhizobium tunisiense TaxID=3144793 RepID=UPI0031F70B92
MSTAENPTREKRPPARHVVARVDEIASGASRLVHVEGRDIAIFNVAGEFMAIANRCPHEGADLCKGKLLSLFESDEPGVVRMSRRGELVRCPWHGWEFDLRSGKSWCDPARTRVKSYDVAVEHGARLVEGTYRAEVFKISVDDDYLVLEL